MSTKITPTVTLPYIERSSEKLRRAFNIAGVPTSFKPYRTLKQSGTVYELSYLNCESVYVGETGRKLEKRLAEHNQGLLNPNLL